MKDFADAMKNLREVDWKPTFQDQPDKGFSLELLDTKPEPPTCSPFDALQPMTVTFSYRYIRDEERQALEIARLVEQLGQDEALRRLKRPLDHKGDACE